MNFRLIAVVVRDPSGHVQTVVREIYVSKSRMPRFAWQPQGSLLAIADNVGPGGGVLRLFELVWHRDALADFTSQPGGWMGAVIVVACSAVIHEALHAWAWHTFARVPWRSLSIRPTWRVMGMVAQTRVAVPARAYRG